MERTLDILKTCFKDMKTAYILYWIPEQGEDSITFLINTDTITNIEFDRYDYGIDPYR